MLDSTPSFKDLMVEVGECIDKMKAHHFSDEETAYCAKIANAMYLMLLTVQEINKCSSAKLEGPALATLNACAEHIHYACLSYLNAPSDYELLNDGIVEGMRAIHSFQLCKNVLNQILKVCREDNEGKAEARE